MKYIFHLIIELFSYFFKICGFSQKFIDFLKKIITNIFITRVFREI